MSRLELDFAGVPDFVDDTIPVTFAQANGAPLDWTGSTFKMRIGKQDLDGDPVELTQADGDIVPSVSGGKSIITFRFRPEKMADLTGICQHRIIRTIGGRDTLFATGKVTLLKDVGL